MSVPETNVRFEPLIFILLLEEGKLKRSRFTMRFNDEGVSNGRFLGNGSNRIEIETLNSAATTVLSIQSEESELFQFSVIW